MIKQGKFETQTGDGKEVGFFFRAPKIIDEERGSLGEIDESPAHITFLYIGELDEDTYDKFYEVSEKFFKTIDGPIEFVLDDKVSVFENDDYWVAHQKVKIPEVLFKARSELKDKLEESGINVGDKWDEYDPHMTLKYMMPGYKYEDDPIKGEWIVFGVESWGLPNLKYFLFNNDHIRKAHKKSEDKKEEEAAEDLIRPEPKVFPPRKDSKKSIINTHSDKDLSSGTDSSDGSDRSRRSRDS